MAHNSDDHPKDAVLDTLAKTLGRGADSFTPESEPDPAPVLPGRRRGEHLADPGSTPTGAAAVVLDCGTSRLDGYTHVLWISPSVESVLGSAAAERVGEIIGSVEGVVGYDWEDLEHLHLRAPGMDHVAVLREARAAVEAHSLR
jgi:hypothetical protein